jgi:hypothetical protein
VFAQVSPLGQPFDEAWMQPFTFAQVTSWPEESQ